MAQTGKTPISLYYSATGGNTPTAGNLVDGELAINTADGKLFYKDSSGVVQTVASKDANAGTFTSVTTTNLTVNGNKFGAGDSSSLKNRIINGAMVIDQRNAGAAITTSGGYPVDRFYVANVGSTSTFSSQQSSTAPAGFTNSLYYTVTAADATLDATDRTYIVQNIEGYNIADLGWGTANAKTVTLSFWVRSSLTGTFGGSLRNSAGNRSYPFTYAISSANTWTQASITIAGDTSGTWETTNGTGITLFIGLGLGSTWCGTAGAWASASYLSATGSVSLTQTTNANLYITGVQLEVGSTASSFDYRQYGTELMLCQRYYEVLTTQNYGTQAPSGLFGYTSWFFKSTMRASPTIVYGSGSVATTGAVSTDGLNAYAASGSYPLINVSSTASAEL